MQAFQVLARQFAGSPEYVAYRTDDENNASTFAESHFINRHAHSVRAVRVRGDDLIPLTDQRGRPYVWGRV